MIVPKSSHDRYCSKELSHNARSTITIPESMEPFWVKLCRRGPLRIQETYKNWRPCGGTISKIAWKLQRRVRLLPVLPGQKYRASMIAQCRLRNSDGWRVFYGWRALRQPCRESRQPCFMVDGAFGQMVDGAMFNFKFWTFWPSVWYQIEIFHTNFSMRVYLA